MALPDLALAATQTRPETVPKIAISGLTMLLCTALALGLLSRRRRVSAARAGETPGNLDEPPAFLYSEAPTSRNERAR